MNEFWPLEKEFGILHGSTEETIFRELIGTCLACVHGDEGSILILDEQANELVVALTVGSESSDDTTRGQRIPLGEGVTGLAALTKHPQIGSPVYKDLHQSELKHDSPNSVLAAPLLLLGDVIGVVTVVTFDTARTFSIDDARILQRISSVAALVIDQRRRASHLSKEKHLHPGGISGKLAESEARVIETVRELIQNDPQRAAVASKLLSCIAQLTSGKP